MITVNCFAHLKEQLGQDRITLEYKELTVQQLLQVLQEKYEVKTETILVAVNEEYAFPEDKITEYDTVALIPPVSGG
ncbi:molybdopterin converting factor subunit 1 [Jeotgalibacillus sp. R-1-5s-1]|uniref:molybdopterin converting factor subunit 1 n=1 Tax=Jeotgalibacillus sp. R-1-5s-1 TaxID=2555897 RepID=UPI00106A0E25|nr:molybdopterin converting factor subunit 1 [Jeotgalibacillus sp. R-1-5s-1]TFE01853.1 molybdopterin converting factor subunit 1 [Jeotgalibacillus sp. R-1-5s-1]